MLGSRRIALRKSRGITTGRGREGNEMELVGGKKGRNEIDAMYEYEELYNTTHDISKIDSVVKIK